MITGRAITVAAVDSTIIGICAHPGTSERRLHALIAQQQRALTEVVERSCWRQAQQPGR